MSPVEARLLVRRSLLLEAPEGAATAPATGLGRAGEPPACCLGVFDGMHRGHQALLAATVADARARGARAVAVTFDPDPDDLLRGPQAAPHLLSCPDRVRALGLAGADEVVVLPFDRELAATPERDFLARWLLPRLRPASVHVGANFRFGDRGAGDVAALSRDAAPLGIRVVGHELELSDGEVVSATRIRSLLSAGRPQEAQALMGRPHFVRGTVEHGRGEGTGMGFPTANVRVPGRGCLPGEGVYAGWLVADGVAWPAAVNVGAPRTFSERQDDHFLEACLVGFSGDLYGREVSVVLWRWLRAARRFGSVAELERVVLSNVEWVRTNVGSAGVEVGA